MDLINSKRVDCKLGVEKTLYVSFGVTVIYPFYFWIKRADRYTHTKLLMKEAAIESEMNENNTMKQNK